MDFDAIPEPFLGSLEGHPSAVFLALNPGRAHLQLQGRAGVFADEIRELGSYSAWAASWPYLRDPWRREMGPNRHHESRLRFLRNWTQSADMDGRAMVGFELYPWHSTAVTGKMRPDPATIREWIWEPVAELGCPVFAFGAPWFDILQSELALTCVARLGKDGVDYGSLVPSRSVSVFRDATSGVTVIAERHLGSAGPPSPTETPLLRSAVDELVGLL